MPNRAEILKQKFQESLGLPFAEVLTKNTIEQVLTQQGIHPRQVVYNARGNAMGVVITSGNYSGSRFRASSP